MGLALKSPDRIYVPVQSNGGASLDFVAATSQKSMEDRYIHNKREPSRREPAPREQLVASLTKIIKGAPPRRPWKDVFKEKPVGLWTGPTAIAYLFLWLAETHPDLEIEGAVPQQWCTRYLDLGSEDLENAHGLNGWGVKNEYLAYNTVKAAATQDRKYAAKVFNTVLNDYHCPDVDNEHLAGRAGTLSLLRIIKRWCPSTAVEVEKCNQLLIDQIMAQTPWRFHGHNYTGAAHGVIGILTQIILSRPKMGRDAKVEELIQEQLDLQADDGHWFITDDPKLGEPDLVHYCHGAPGYIISLLAIKPFVKPELQHRIDKAAALGRKQVWEKGLLRKEPNLCHGIIGNMLAFDDWKQREHFMSYATEEGIQKGKEDGTFARGDDPYGLFWGEAGRAWGWMIMDTRVDRGYPSYTDL